MLGINCESSDDEDVAPMLKTELLKPAIVTPVPKPVPAVDVEPSAPPGPVNGPAQGPQVSLSVEESSMDNAAPGSPYTSNRTMIQNLTLPTVPNWNIPPSPPGSPPQRATKKFAQFLDLKKKGQHFNQRLESSSVMRDPTHSQKLMDFAGIGEVDQYTSSLPEGLGVSTLWPEWAYGEELNTSQKKIAEAKKEARSKAPRGPVEFVPAKSGASSRSGTPSAKEEKHSATERVTAGLVGQQPKHSPAQSTGKRKELEHRGVKNGSSANGGWQSRSRSPKRRRSRSRDRR